MERRNIASDAAWEPMVGYSRAVRVGPFVAVAGTTASDPEGHALSPGDAYSQAITIFGKIEHALKAAGASRRDVVRTRMFVTDIDDWREIGRAHAEFFGDVRPAATLVQVSRLLEPEMRVEIEADAILPTPG